MDEAEFVEDDQRLYGRVKWYNKSRGFGFIIADDGREIFFHFTGIDYKVAPNQGDRVSFKVIDTNKGPEATGTMRVEPAEG